MKKPVRYLCTKCSNVTPHKPIRCVICGSLKFVRVPN